MKKIIYITALWLIGCLSGWAGAVVINFYPYDTPANLYNRNLGTANPGFEYDLLFSVGYRALAAQPCSMDKAGTFFLPAGTSLDITGQSIPMNENNCIQNNLFNISCFVPDVDFHWSGVRFSIQSPPPVPPGPLPPVPLQYSMAATMGNGGPGTGINCVADFIGGGHLYAVTPLGYEIRSTSAMPPTPPWFGNNNGPRMTFVDLGVTQIYTFW